MIFYIFLLGHGYWNATKVDFSSKFWVRHDRLRRWTQVMTSFSTKPSCNKCRKSICSKHWSNIPLKWDASISKMPSHCVSEHLQPKWSQTLQDQYSQNGQRLVGIGTPNDLISMPAPFGPSAVRRTCTTGAQVEHNRSTTGGRRNDSGAAARRCWRSHSGGFFGWDGGSQIGLSLQKMLGLKLPQFPKIRNLGFPRFERH